MGKLTARSVAALTKPGRYGDGDGLWLQVRDADRRSWLLRYMLDGRAREMGLGPLSLVSLADARAEALAWRKLLHKGADPLDHRNAQRAIARLNVTPTFGEVAELYVKAHEAGWRNAKHRRDWKATLDTYVVPVFGELRISDVDTGAVMRALEPIWREKPETASRLRGRIEVVLDMAKTRGWREGENPARWKGHLANLLPAREKLGRVAHHPALSWAEIGAFMAVLRKETGVGSRALEFTILTAARSGEVIGATWAEIDLMAAIWTVPADRMKAGVEHRVPLSGAALNILRGMADRRHHAGDNAFVFPGRDPGKKIGNSTMIATLARMKWGSLTTHGFRSTFRDWCSERTSYPREVPEAALAHTLADKVEAAYRRGDLFQKRRRLMEEWAAWCETVEQAGAEVVAIGGRGR